MFKKITALAAAGAFAFGLAAATPSVEAAQKNEPPKVEQPAPQVHQDKQDKNQPAAQNQNKPQAKTPAPEQKSQQDKNQQAPQDKKPLPQHK